MRLLSGQFWPEKASGERLLRPQKPPGRGFSDPRSLRGEASPTQEASGERLLRLEKPPGRGSSGQGSLGERLPLPREAG
jgi:hypothetical protein